MNGRYGVLTGMVLSCALLLCGMDAHAACTSTKRNLKLDTHKIEMVERDKRCVQVGDDDSTTFEIWVQFAQGYSVDLSDIEVTKKDTAGLVSFVATPIVDEPNKKVLSVRLTWDSKPDHNAEFGYNVTVAGLGKLDPKVQIIRQNFASFYSDALAQLAQEHLDEGVYDKIIKEGLLPKLPATASQP